MNANHSEWLISAVLDGMKRVDWLIKYADTVPANSVRALPETVIGPVGNSARFLLADVSNRLAKRGSRVLAGGELDQDDGRYLNAVLVLGVQGIPVPMSMWHPFGKAGAAANVWGHSGLIDVEGKRTGVLICYEQLLTYSVLWMMTENPNVLVGASNLWWVTDKTIPVIQDQMMRTYGRLFSVSVIRAVNTSL
jgi:apolipoprotein N-acyltransferase